MKVFLWILKAFLIVSVFAGMLSYGILAEKVYALGIVTAHEINVTIPLEAYKMALIDIGIIAIVCIVVFALFIVFLLPMIDFFYDVSDFRKNRDSNKSQDAN